MRAAVITSPNHMEMQELSVPVPTGDEALIRIIYTGICGSDVHIYKGESSKAKQNVIVGHEYSGVIETVAATACNPQGLKPGDKVVGWIIEACGVCEACIGGHTNTCRNLKCYGTQIDGTFREYITAPTHMLYKLPDDANLRLYALVEPMAVAVYAVRETPVLLGDRVLVIGGGPIGICTALAARRAGASQVVVSEIAPEKIARIISLGFDVINAAACDPVAAAREMTQGRGFNCVLEASASAAGYTLMTKVGSYRAKGMNIGVTEHALPLVPREIMNNEMYIKSIRVHQQSVFALTVDIFNSMDKAFREDLLKLISHDFPFSQLPAVFDFCDKDRSTCKVMIHFDEP